MRLPCAPSHAVRGLRKPLALARNGQRHFLHTSTYNAAVIGGGITGLTTAFRLSKDPKCTKVTLYEKAPRAGGWLSSETIAVDGGHIMFDYGARTLRSSSVPACLPLVDLIVELDLVDQVVLTHKLSPAALNRYIYYPDHLVRVPGWDSEFGFLWNMEKILTTVYNEPALYPLIPGIFNDILAPSADNRGTDESVADFVSRRTNKEVADNLVSGMMHGIYAGDIDRLSAQAVLGSARVLENNGNGVFLGMLKSGTSQTKQMNIDDLLALETVQKKHPISYWKALRALVENSSVLTFKKGVGQLSDALVSALIKSKKADFVVNTEVKSIMQDQKTSDFTVVSSQQNHSRVYNRVISTTAPTALAKQLGDTPHERANYPGRTIADLKTMDYAVTVMVVNLYFPKRDLLPVTGFGYLIPRSIPYEQNPENALGVIFGSDSSAGQDTAPGTKLTVMMGGHWWDGWKESDYPDHETAVAMARRLLHRHLGITDTPTVARTRLQKNAIPQYTVGHQKRMFDLSNNAKWEFNQRLSLAGSWYNGVGVVDCIRQAYLTSSFGVGRLDADETNGDRPWSRFSNVDWDMEGGIATSPVRSAEVYPNEFQHF